jgi:hypothetical protein
MAGTIDHALRLRAQARELERWADEYSGSIAETYGMSDEGCEYYGSRSLYLGRLAARKRSEAMQILEDQIAKGATP